MCLRVFVWTAVRLGNYRVWDRKGSRMCGCVARVACE